MKDHLSWIKQVLGMDGPDSPGENNADVLLRMAKDGDDLTKPREIDFHHLFTCAADAAAFVETARVKGYTKVDHDFSQDQNAWLTAVHIEMVPALEEITATELDLDEIAAFFDGKPDGWGCMEVM